MRPLQKCVSFEHTTLGFRNLFDIPQVWKTLGMYVSLELRNLAHFQLFTILQM